MLHPRTEKNLVSLLVWGIALFMFFPILWMLVISVKTELEAIGSPLQAFIPTFENYVNVFERNDYLKNAWNSIWVSSWATFLGIVLAIPTVYALAFHPTKRTQMTLVWILSTKMLPSVGVLMPIYFIFQKFHLLDTTTGLVFIYTLINLPIIVWMLFIFFKEIPVSILEAARIDGAEAIQQFYYILIPVTLPGIATTALLSIILCWNEAFWSLNLANYNAATLTYFIASYSSPQGLFWAKLSAASTLAIAPIIMFGWIAQKGIVRGLTAGADKG